MDDRISNPDGSERVMTCLMMSRSFSRSIYCPESRMFSRGRPYTSNMSKRRVYFRQDEHSLLECRSGPVPVDRLGNIVIEKPAVESHHCFWFISPFEINRSE